MDDLLREFLVETGENLVTVDTQLVTLEHEPDNQDIVRAIFRLVHTIKGTCGFFGLPRLEAVAHAAETLMGNFRDGAPVTRDAVSLILTSIDRIKSILAGIEATGTEPPGDDAALIAALEARARGETMAEALVPVAAAPEIRVEWAADGGATDMAAVAEQATLRVNVETIEQLMTMVSELVLTRNQLFELARHNQNSVLGASMQRLNHVTGALQDCVMKTRLQPVSQACQKLPRLVRDLSVELGKDIALVITGAETDLDRQVLDLIKDPLTHLVRNAADHGIEKPAVRLAAGKPARGVIQISARHSGSALVIDIRDDGRGLDLPRIRAKAMERRLASEAELERMNDARVARMIFHPGFSTADTVSAISGRGVGMDVVAANVERAGGRVDVQTRAGQGTHFTITLPLTLAIAPALLVRVGAHRFAVPQSAIAELVRIGPGSDAVIEPLDRGAMLRLRGVLYPLVSLSALLGLEETEPAEGDSYGALLSIGGRQFAVQIDAVLQTEEIVVKPISAKLRHLALYSGCTILGDGAVVLILEPNGLARLVLGEAADVALESPPVEEAASASAGSSALLIVRTDGQRQALSLAAITRLEYMALNRLEWSGAQALLHYQGRLMPVARLAGALARGMAGDAVCIVLHHQGKTFGLLCDEVLDVTESGIELSFDPAVNGTLGTAIVQGAATDIVDALFYFAHFFPDMIAATPRDAALRPLLRPLLLIERDSFFRDMLTPVLRAAGYAVIVKDDLAQAVAQAASCAAIIVDCDAAADADQAMDALCAAGRGVPLIGLSSALDEATRSRLQARGVTALVSKFDRRGLVAMLRHAIPSTPAAQEAA